MTTLINNLTSSDSTPDESGDTERIGSRIGRINPDNFSNQSGDADSETEKNGLFDKPTDEDGDPTDASDHGEYDHRQDDNYALGGHVTRSGSV